jgi:hypothetical protein
LKSLDCGAIRIEFVNNLPTTFNGDILFELSLIRYPLRHFEQLQGMDKNFNRHVWCKLQTGNINNSFGLGFKMTKCLGHLSCQNDYCLLFQHSFMHNNFSWNGDNLQLPIYGQCLVKSHICTINYKFCKSSPKCLQTCSCRMYYVVHKFPNLSRVAIHLGIHAHPIVDSKCKESF